MRYSSLFSAIALVSSFGLAAPALEACQATKVADYNPGSGDITILNYALTLECLERKFYTNALSKNLQENLYDGQARCPHSMSIDSSQYAYAAGSSVTFTHAKGNTIKAGSIKEATPVYAMFLSGLDVYYVKAYETTGNSRDLNITHIPGAENGNLARRDRSMLS
ncbi:hypothetical protein BJ878DRAFT_538104 [Calycina marina]|uniref:Uncharacterized protein n=1 Tax=Calycina marina TaxID=1763456 RepID=A0A9P7ZB29_9HELO|nr:hypothetical protein BJ878DRAFT_538104 [Calycina marina]